MIGPGRLTSTGEIDRRRSLTVGAAPERTVHVADGLTLCVGSHVRADVRRDAGTPTDTRPRRGAGSFRGRGGRDRPLASRPMCAGSGGSASSLLRATRNFSGPSTRGSRRAERRGGTALPSPPRSGRRSHARRRRVAGGCTARVRQGGGIRRSCLRSPDLTPEPVIARPVAVLPCRRRAGPGSRCGPPAGFLRAHRHSGRPPHTSSRTASPPRKIPERLEKVTMDAEGQENFREFVESRSSALLKTAVLLSGVTGTRPRICCRTR